MRVPRDTGKATLETSGSCHLKATKPTLDKCKTRRFPPHPHHLQLGVPGLGMTSRCQALGHGGGVSPRPCPRRTHASAWGPP